MNQIPGIIAIVVAGMVVRVPVASARGQAAAQDSARARPAQPAVLFQSDAPLRLRLEVDLKTLVNDRDSVSDTYYPATLTYQEGDAAPVSVEAKLRTRGHWRRQKRNCDFPPLLLNVPRGDVEGTVFADQDKLKLVTPCKPARREYEEYILREYLVYKVYNLLTPLSLRARLATTTYVDTRGGDSLTRQTFLVEEAEQMAARNGGKLLEIQGARFADVDSLQLGIAGVFLYMIGGTDWSLSAQHNMQLVQGPGPQEYHPVPYDFDFTGIVNTAYAGPDPRLRLRSVRDRLYRGGCLTDATWDAVLARFRERKAEIYALYQNQPGLSSRYVKDTHGYLDDFYRVIDDPKKVSSELMRRCREG